MYQGNSSGEEDKGNSGLVGGAQVFSWPEGRVPLGRPWVPTKKQSISEGEGLSYGEGRRGCGRDTAVVIYFHSL